VITPLHATPITHHSSLITHHSSLVDVSVIIPCYNYARFLPEAVASIVVQTFASWEIIIVDDGSADDTSTVAQRLLRQYAGLRLRAFRQPNRGASAARNTGACYAQGVYLLFLDADDMLAPTMLERAVAVLQQRAEVGFVYAGMQLFDKDWSHWPSVRYDARILALDNIVPAQSLMRRAAWQQVGGFDEVHFPHGFEDWDLWLRIAAAGWQGYHINAPLVYYRRHGPSLSTIDWPGYEWDARAQIMRKHPQIYGHRLAMWATRRCAQRNLPSRATEHLALDTADVQELSPSPELTAETQTAPRYPSRQPGDTTLVRRLIRAVPFRLRIQVKWLLRRVQLALRATGLWP
jgi:GT2 family glycosyltransferase